MLHRHEKAPSRWTWNNTGWNKTPGEASSSSGPATAVQEAVPIPSSRSQEVRMEVTGSSSSRPLEEGDESASQRVRNLAGMLLCDENDTSDWQNSIQEANTLELNNEQRGAEHISDQAKQPDTDIPGVWQCQVEPKSDLVR